MRSRDLAVASVFVVLSLVFTGCSITGSASESTGSSASPDTERDERPAAGETITGFEYSYVVPDGWGEPTTAASSPAPDSVAANLEDTDDFPDNVSVFALDSGKAETSLVERVQVDQLKAFGATGVTVNDRVTVAGSESPHLTITGTEQGKSFIAEQYYVSTDDQTYIVTFAFSETVGSAERVKIADSVLATWKWS